MFLCAYQPLGRLEECYELKEAVKRTGGAFNLYEWRETSVL